MKRLTHLEEVIKHQHARADALQRRLSERRRQTVQLSKDLFRSQESARIANEAADSAEHQLSNLVNSYNDMAMHYSAMELRMEIVQNQSVWSFLMEKLGRLIAKSCVSAEEYYGLPALKDHKK